MVDADEIARNGISATRLRQAELITRWGESPTGSITPRQKIPMICNAYSLTWGGFRSGEMGRYIQRRLARSHIFVAFTRGQFTHSVLVYRMRDTQNDVSFMDPDGGQYRTRPVAWLEAQGPFVAMRKP